MDEMARAAAEFCRVADTVPRDRFLREQPSDDPDTVSIRAVCAHVVRAAYGHANYIRQIRKMDALDPRPAERSVAETPDGVRSLLRRAVLYVEEAVRGLDVLPGDAVAAMTFQVRWGPVYDPEMMMEHAVMHLLRHRRQIERWPAEG